MLINVLRDEQPTHVAVAFDVSRQTFRSEEYADYKANRSATPDEFQGQVSLIKEVLGRAARCRSSRTTASRPTTSSRTLTTQALAEDYRGPDLHRVTATPSSWSPTSTTVLYPMRGRLRADADDPGRGRGEVRRAAASATPTSPRWWARPRTTCPACPGSGPRPPPSGSASTAASTERRRPRRRDQGQGGGVPARAPRRRASATGGSTQLVRDLDAAADARATSRVQHWDREAGAHGLRRAGVPGAARPALRDPRVARGGGRRPGFDLDGDPCSSPASVAGWLDDACRRPAAASASHVVGPWARGHRRRAAPWPSPRPMAPRPTSTSPTLDPDGRRGGRGLAGRPDRAQGAARRQGPDAGPRGAGLAARRARPATPPWRPTWPGRTSAPTTWPT